MRCPPRRRRVVGALFFAVLTLGLFAFAAGCAADDGGNSSFTSGTTAGSLSTSTTLSPLITTTLAAEGSGTSGTMVTAGGSGAPRTTVTYADPTATDSSGPGGAMAESNALARELKRNVTAANERIAAYQEAGSSPTDPAGGEIYALRARGQAIVARRAIVDNQMDLADGALRECTKLLARAEPVTDTTAALIAVAVGALSQSPAPSQDAELAASYLDEVIQALAPLVDPPDTSTTTRSG